MRNMTKRSFLAVALSMTLSVVISHAQTALPDQGSASSRNLSQIVFFSFFHFHEALQSEIDKRLAADPSRAKNLADAALRMMGLSAADFATVTRIVRSANRDLDLVRADAIAYSSSARAGGQAPDIDVIRGFEKRKSDRINSAVAELQKNLSPQGWSSLQAYIAEQFSKHVTTWSLSR